ncbi:hypothetical protein BDR26DRAFT_850915 [Obelidium mucronatum]|nr:hypothetical protein BDR26DRAFT_850915 [Obelidium mucronatum]
MDKLNAIRTLLPEELLLTRNSPQQTRFMINFQGSDRVMDSFLITLLFHASICVVNRPTLYLSHYLPLTSPLLVNNPENMTKILASIDASITAALSIAELVSWLIHQSNSGQDGENGQLRQKLWREREFLFASFVLFEACTVLWWVTCRTQAFWWRDGIPGEALVMSPLDRKRMRIHVLDILKTLKDLESDVTKHEHEAFIIDDTRDERNRQIVNMITPMVVCIEAQVQEMEKAEFSFSGMHVCSRNENVDKIIVGMKVMAVVDEDGKWDDPTTEQNPWVLMGLLGVDIGGIQWRGCFEEEWRLFWSKCCH